MKARAGNGMPRVGEAPIVGSPYNTTPDVRQVLARLERSPPGHVDQPPTDLEPGVLALPHRLIDRISGFLDRIEQQHFSGRGATVPPHVKDPTMAHFGDSLESTKMWGDSTSNLSFTDALSGAVVTQAALAQKLFRQRPTTMTVLSVLTLQGAAAWTSETGPNILTLFYQVGVGQNVTTIARIVNFTTITGTFFGDTNSAIFDIVQLPMQSMVVHAQLAASNISRPLPHNCTLTTLVAPIVQ